MEVQATENSPNCVRVSRRPSNNDRVLRIGSRIRKEREKNKVSLKFVADRINISPEQIRKYECGIDRISADRLEEIAELFGVPVSSFYKRVRSDA